MVIGYGHQSLLLPESPKRKINSFPVDFSVENLLKGRKMLEGAAEGVLLQISAGEK